MLHVRAPFYPSAFGDDLFFPIFGLGIRSLAHSLTSVAGATIAEILSYVETFYSDDAKAATNAQESGPSHGSVSRQSVDGAFQEKVWKWLTKHPDVYVGRNKEGNKLTLREAKASSSPKGNTLTPAVEEKTTSAGILQDGDQTAPATAPAQMLPQDSTFAILQFDGSKALRVFVSEERIWYAVAGHALDLSRMQRMDFKLLSIIAAHREKGILQPDLTRISGQDKRSTPPRTQRLHDKGYIEKKKVQTRGQVTSLCTLRKFVYPSSKSPSNPTEVAEDVIRRGTFVTKAGPQEELIDVKALLRGMFDILNEYSIVTHLDLKRKLVAFPSFFQIRE